MKIVITITSSEISTLIQQHLAKGGMKVNVEDIKYSKGTAVVTADAPMDELDEEPATPEALGAAVFNAPPVTPAQAPAPTLAVVDGGQAPVDMNAILRESAKNAANPGKFPVPERQLMDGESFEYPKDKR